MKTVITAAMIAFMSAQPVMAAKLCDSPLIMSDQQKAKIEADKARKNDGKIYPSCEDVEDYIMLLRASRTFSHSTGKEKFPQSMGNQLMEMYADAGIDPAEVARTNILNRLTPEMKSWAEANFDKYEKDFIGYKYKECIADAAHRQAVEIAGNPDPTNAARNRWERQVCQDQLARDLPARIERWNRAHEENQRRMRMGLPPKPVDF